MSLRRRLVLFVTALFALGSIVFASVALVTIDRSLRSAIDGKLETLAKAIADVVDDRNGHAYVDADDIRQLKALQERDEHVSIVDEHGRRFYGEAIPDSNDARGFRFAHATAVHRGHYDGQVTTWRDGRFVDDVVRATAMAFIGTSLVLCTLAFVFANLYARSILAPVQRVADLAERIETSDLSKRLDATGSDELARLCRSFDRMLGRLEESFEAQRRFVADASHELRTPLAVIRAETDLALRRERTGAEYQAALGSIDRETACLEELVDRLLETMRSESLVETLPLALEPLVADVCERFRNVARAMSVGPIAGDLIVVGDRASLERAIGAVMRNAVVHGDGTVDVAVRASDETISVAIADRGRGFSDEALTFATTRFWRGDSARTRGSTGLGLAIARVLVEAHGGTIALANRERGGAVVTIALPRARITAPAAV